MPIQTKLEPQLDSLELSDDITLIDIGINHIIDDTNRRVNIAMASPSLAVYKEHNSIILQNKDKLQKLLFRYIELERKNGFPINLKYRDWNKRLLKMK